MNMVEQAPAVSTSESELTLDELRLRLDEARTEWAQVSSRRQNRLFERRIHGYNATKERYNQLVIDYGRQELAETLESTTDDSERKQITVAYIISQQNELRELTDKTVEGKRSRKFGRAIGKWLTTGSRTVQFAKGATLGVAASLSGGLVGAGIAGLAAVNFAKGYLTSEVRGLGRTDIDETELLDAYPDDGEQPSFETLLERAQTKSAEIFDVDGKEQQSHRRQAAKRGLGVMATGIVFGGVIGLAVDGFNTPNASATPGSENYTTPGLVDTHTNAGLFENTSSNPGIANVDTHTGPGLTDMQSHANPGIAELPVAPHDSPGLIETSSTGHASPDIATAETADTHSKPGLATDTSHSSPDIAQPADTHASPRIIDVDTHTNPNVAQSGDTHTNPGLIDGDSHGNPDMADSADTHASPGLADGNTHNNHDVANNPDNGFTVEYGNGYTHELMEAAAANGVDMTTEQAWAAHQVIVDQVGADYIDLTDHSGSDTYSMGDTQYETGISAPGEATWSAEALELVNDATDDGEVNEGVEAPQADTPVAPDTTNPDAGQDSQSDTPDNDNGNAAERNEARVIERSGLVGLEEANQDSADWNDMQRDMQRMENLLRDGNFDAVNQTNAFQDTLGYIAYDSEGMTYPASDVEFLAWDNATERWALNPIPEGSYIPSSVIELVNSYTTSLDRLAA